MPIDPVPQRLDQQVRVLQIIVGALMFGVISFGVVAIVIRIGKQGGGDSPVWMIAGGFAVMMLIARQIVGVSMVNGIRRQIAKGTWQPPTKGGGPAFPADATDADRLLSLLQTVTIVQCALPEGAAFFNLIAYIMSGHLASLATVAVLLLWMSSSFPTRDRVVNWIGRQLELVELERGQPS
ncbi:MAG: hypothetical protein HZA46_18230 [Planctomycetales bacterium]|nr:hypothetical protein [Planctomycetales bacterium]